MLDTERGRNLCRPGSLTRKPGERVREISAYKPGIKRGRRLIMGKARYRKRVYFHWKGEGGYRISTFPSQTEKQRERERERETYSVFPLPLNSLALGK